MSDITGSRSARAKRTGLTAEGLTGKVIAVAHSPSGSNSQEWIWPPFGSQATIIRLDLAFSPPKFAVVLRVRWALL